MKKTDTVQSRRLSHWTIKELFDAPGKTIGDFCRRFNGGITYAYFNQLTRNKRRDIHDRVLRPRGFDAALARYLGCKMEALYEPVRTEPVRECATIGA